jgi:hypothetical protein
MLPLGESVVGVPIEPGPTVRLRQDDGSIRIADTLLVRADGKILTVVVGFRCSEVVHRMISSAREKIATHGCSQVIFARRPEGWSVAAWISDS